MKTARLAALLVLVQAACGGSGDDAGGVSGSPTPSPTTYARRLLSSLDRTAVERTRSDMNAIRTAIVAAATESGQALPATDFASLVAAIAPAYIRTVPRRDYWGYEFVYENRADGWALIAPGADGAAGSKDDIVLTEAGFAQLPEGYTGAFQ